MHKLILSLGIIISFLLASCGNSSAPQSEKASVSTTIEKEAPSESEKNQVENVTEVSLSQESETPEENIEDNNEIVEESANGTSDLTNAPTPTKTDKVVEKETAPAKEEVVVKEPSKSPSKSSVQAKPAPKVDHVPFDALLRKYVSNGGKVNYAGIKTDKSKLNAYIKTLQSNHPESSWSKNEQLAFWINAYNAFTIKLIVDNYPVGSITDLHKGDPWNNWKGVKIGSKTYTLNNIENDIIRPQFKDARIHFAVNCAAKSCPRLLNRAFFASTLNTQLDKQTKSFINSAGSNTIGANAVKISKIFDWYKVDFEGGNVVSFLNKYSTTKINANASVSYLEYDWKLNRQ